MKAPPRRERGVRKRRGAQGARGRAGLFSAPEPSLVASFVRGLKHSYRVPDPRQGLRGFQRRRAPCKLPTKRLRARGWEKCEPPETPPLTGDLRAVEVTEKKLCSGWRATWESPRGPFAPGSLRPVVFL